jgi:hypothetical protein
MTAQETVVELLRAGPRTPRELTEALGYDPGDAAGLSYVRLIVSRLSRRGYTLLNVRPAGSHRGAYYILVARPREHHGERVCIDCGRPLRTTNEGDRCGACETEYLRLAELPWPRILQLPFAPATQPGEMVAS